MFDDDEAEIEGCNLCLVVLEYCDVILLYDGGVISSVGGFHNEKHIHNCRNCLLRQLFLVILINVHQFIHKLTILSEYMTVCEICIMKKYAHIFHIFLSFCHRITHLQ